MKTRKLSWLLLLLVAASAEAKVSVVTTLPSFADIAARVGGDDVSVVSLTKGTQDPHFVDAKPDLILKLNRAQLLIRAGLGLEDGWLPPLLTGARNGSIQMGADGHLDASTLMKLKDVPAGKLDRAEGDVHAGGNPHFMLDPRNGIVLAQGIAQRLAKLDPAHAEAFAARAKAYGAELEGKIQQWSTALQFLKGAPVVTYHKSWVYFLDWTGAVGIDTVEPKPGIPPSPEHTVKLIALMKQRQVKWILMEPFYPAGVAEEVAAQTGARRLVLPTEVGAEGAGDYAAIFEVMIRKLKEGGK